MAAHIRNSDSCQVVPFAHAHVIHIAAAIAVVGRAEETRRKPPCSNVRIDGQDPAKISAHLIRYGPARAAGISRFDNETFTLMTLAIRRLRDRMPTRACTESNCPRWN